MWQNVSTVSTWVCLWSDDADGASVIRTTHTHIPSVFQQKPDDDAVNSTYFDQRIPVPEDQNQVNTIHLQGSLCAHQQVVTVCEGNTNTRR